MNKNKKMHLVKFFSSLTLFFAATSFADSDDIDIHIDGPAFAIVPDISPLQDGGDCFAMQLLTPSLFTTENGTPVGPGTEFIVECVTSDKVYDFTGSLEQMAYQPEPGRQYSATWIEVDSLEIRDSLGFASVVDLSEFGDTSYSEYQSLKQGLDDDQRQLFDVAFLAWTIIDKGLNPTNEDDTSVPATRRDISSLRGSRNNVSVLATQSLVFSTGSGISTHTLVGSYPRVTSMSAALACPGGSCARGAACNSVAKNKKLAHGNASDDCGHIVGRQLGGSGSSFNAFPQDRTINRGAFAQHERGIRDAMEINLCPMALVITFGFSSNSATRPNSVTYFANCLLPNGTSNTMVFSN